MTLEIDIDPFLRSTFIDNVFPIFCFCLQICLICQFHEQEWNGHVFSLSLDEQNREKRLFNHRSKTSSFLTKSTRSVRLLIGSLTDVELKTKIVKCDNEEEEERKTYAIDDCQELIDLLWKSFDGIVIFSSHSFITFFEQFHLRRFAQSSPASEFLPDEGEDLVLISTVSQSRLESCKPNRTAPNRRLTVGSVRVRLWFSRFGSVSGMTPGGSVRLRVWSLTVRFGCGYDLWRFGSVAVFTSSFVGFFSVVSCNPDLGFYRKTALANDIYL